MHSLDFIHEELQQLENHQLLNPIRTVESPMGAYIQVNGKRVLNLSSNDYLGLSNHPTLKKAAIQAIERLGVGPGAVRSIVGNLSLHEEAERLLASYKGVEATLLVQSGFLANQAVIPVLMGKEDVIFTDSLNHASIIDGCKLSRAKVVVYETCDMNDLNSKVNLYLKDYRRGMVVSDGVFSMDGSIAPLDSLYAIAKDKGLISMIDDAHGEGVLGKNGAGIVSHFGLNGQFDIEVGTLSKAFGSVGGFVAGKAHLIRYLKQRARPFLFSTGLPASEVAACMAGVELLQSSNHLIERLWLNAEWFQRNLVQAGFDIGATKTPITPLMLKDEVLTNEFSQALLYNNILAMPIKYPTVAKGKARLRLMVSASHSQEDLKQALETLVSVGQQLGVIQS